MSGIRVTEGTATVELDAVGRTSAAGRFNPLYSAADLLRAAARALDAAGEGMLADRVRDLTP